MATAVLLSRESLPRQNEQICFTNLREAVGLIETGIIPQKGELALVLEGSDGSAANDNAFWADMDVPTHVAHYQALGFSKMDAIKKVAKDRGVAKSVIYNEV